MPKALSHTFPDHRNGWAQSNFNQIDLLVSNGLVKDELNDQWKFIQTELPAVIKTHGTSHFSGNPVLYDSLEVTLNNVMKLRQDKAVFICRSDALNPDRP